MTRRIDPADRLLATGLPLDRPFDTKAAAAAGLDSHWRHRLVDLGLLTRPVKGVYVSSAAPDTLELRLACVRLLLPPGCVITDRTAAWLHGAPMALAPNDHLEVPRISVFHLPHRRLTNDATNSGSRHLRPDDVVEIGGLLVTTPLRTACDLGRILRRDSAFAALDAVLRLGRFSRDELVAEVDRFRGFRGVRQLRAFAPLADAGSESFGESVLRLRWHEASLGEPPETQVVVRRPGRSDHARLDIGCTEYGYAAEYDGEAFHGPDRAEHDARRRRWIEDELGWIVGVFRRDDVFGRHEIATARMRIDVRRAKLRSWRASA